MSSSRVGSVPSRTGVTSMVTVTFLSPRRGVAARLVSWRHMPTFAALVAARPDQERGGRAPPERLVRQPTDHAVSRDAFGPAPAAPPVRTVGRFDGLAQQQRPVPVESLAESMAV